MTQGSALDPVGHRTTGRVLDGLERGLEPTHGGDAVAQGREEKREHWEAVDPSADAVERTESLVRNSQRFAGRNALKNGDALIAAEDWRAGAFAVSARRLRSRPRRPQALPSPRNRKNLRETWSNHLRTDPGTGNVSSGGEHIGANPLAWPY